MSGKSSRQKTKANSTPKAKASQVKDWWDRAFNEEGGYAGHVVRTKSVRGSKISFQFVNAEGEVDKKVHSVDLDDGDVVWGDLPSTAQLVKAKDKKRFGLLFVAPSFAARVNAPALDGGGGVPKWPRPVSLL